eukprot:Clim_evm28s166 gene=Clim_evmTU28s166
MMDLSKFSKKIDWLAVGLGQLLALFLTGTAVTSQLLAKTYDVYLPTTQGLVNYVMLALCFGIVTLRNHGTEGIKQAFTRCKEDWAWYLVCVIADVEGNYMVVLAYQYTNLASIQLLDCLAIFSAMVLSRVLLRRVFSLYQYVAAGICVLGVVCLVVADVESTALPSGAGWKESLLGDGICTIGALLYGASNVTQEYIVRKYGTTHTLFTIGFWGLFLSIFQILILEYHELNQHLGSEWAVWGLIAGYSFFLFCMYATTPFLLKRANAVVFNLSLLSTDFYTLIAAVVIFAYHFSVLYLVAFLITISGLIYYHWEMGKDPSMAQGHQHRSEYNVLEDQ